MALWVPWTISHTLVWIMFPSHAFFGLSQSPSRDGRICITRRYGVSLLLSSTGRYDG